MDILITLIFYASQIMQILIVIWALMSFVPNLQRHPIATALDQMVSPIIRPFQRVLPNLGGLDFSPFLALVTIRVVGDLLIRFLSGFAHAGL